MLINIRNSSGGISFTCSGTVLSAHAVLTAGHCLAGAAAADVVLGGDDVPADSLNVSPGYQNAGDSSTDVGVLLTATDLGRPAFPILSSRDAVVGEQAVVAGWGLDQNGVGTTLRAGFSAVSGVGPYYLQTQFVPGSAAGTATGLCNGDSGAPILVSAGGWAIAGIASSITGSCTTAGTDSFANVRDPDVASFIASLVPDVGRR